MSITEILTSKDTDAILSFQDLMNTCSSILLIIAIIMTILLVIWFVKRKYNMAQTQPRKPSIARTAFTSNHFGVVCDNEKPENGVLRYALICNGKGEELCRYEETDGQTILGFSSSDGILYMYTRKTLDDGTQDSCKWMFVPEHNELVECD